MTEKSKAYIEAVANGTVPSEEARKEFVEDTRDYTWARTKFEEIMNMDWYEGKPRFTDFAE
jgi:hypothetical protein